MTKIAEIYEKAQDCKDLNEVVELLRVETAIEMLGDNYEIRPKRVIDPEKQEKIKAINKAIKAKEKELGRHLTKEEKDQIKNNKREA